MAKARPGADAVTLLLGGDVMTGRGLDQILPHPCLPALSEPWVASARDYVRLAEDRNGPLEPSIDFAYPWGDALGELDARAPGLRIVNLETSITRSEDRAPKPIHYRMSPENLPVLEAARIDACALANNHVLDHGEAGLMDTLGALDGAGIRRAGAGRNREEAEAPAVLELPEGTGRVLLLARAATSSGVPSSWGAFPARLRGGPRSGVALLPRSARAAAGGLAKEIAARRRPGDLVVLSIHWGPNWGYRVDPKERELAHRLVDEAGVDVVFGHSSHHPRPPEVYGDRPILYGCGDLLNDYEGIGGHAGYRPDLVAAWLVTLSRADGRLLALEAIPFRLRRLRLARANADDAAWLRDALEREGTSVGTRLEVTGAATLRWAGDAVGPREP